MREFLLKKQTIALMAAAFVAVLAGVVLLWPGGVVDALSNKVDSAVAPSAIQSGSSTSPSESSASSVSSLALSGSSLDRSASSAADASAGGGGSTADSPAARAANAANAINSVDDPYAQGANGGSSTGGSGSSGGRTVSLSIDCLSILNNMSQVAPNKVGIVPSSGYIMTPHRVSINEGDTVWDVLSRECRDSGILVASMTSPVYKSVYIQYIANLGEFDAGSLSGWMYNVNGWYPNYGCSGYVLKDGDVIQWRYTCDLGADVGGSNATQG